IVRHQEAFPTIAEPQHDRHREVRPSIALTTTGPSVNNAPTSTIPEHATANQQPHPAFKRATATAAAAFPGSVQTRLLNTAGQAASPSAAPVPTTGLYSSREQDGR
ncbi:hypothetical protein, partial [Streptosporangium lutulentum]